MEEKRYWNEEIMTMDPAAIKALQFEKLKRQLRYEYDHSEYYRERIAAAGIVPEKMESFEEFERIPLFDKNQHREIQEESLSQHGHPYGLHLCAPLERVIGVNATSGTTGIPTFYTFTKKDVQIQSETIARSLWVAGVRPKDTILHALALSMFVGGIPFYHAMQYLGAVSLPMGAEAGTRRLLEFADLTRPTAMFITPSFAEYLMEKCPEHLGREIKTLGIKTIMCAGEPGAGDPAVRRKLQEGYGAKVYDAMGGAWGYMSVVCENLQGQHIVSLDYNYLELIDPETKKAMKLEDGAIGTVANTALEWEAGPILRYDLGDVTQVFTSPCSCGMTGFRIKMLGRTDDMLILKGINVYPAAVKNAVAEFFPRVTGEVRILLDEPGPKITPPLHIKVEHGKKERDLEKLKKDLEQRFHDSLRFRAEVELVPPETLERTTKKARLIDKRYEQKQ